MGLSHSHFVPGIVTALTAFPLAPPHRGSGDIEMGGGGHGILQGLGPGLVFPSSGGLRQQPRSMASASDLRSYCPVGVFLFVFPILLRHCDQGLPVCFPASLPLGSSGPQRVWSKTRDRERLPTDPCPLRLLLCVRLRDSASPRSALQACSPSPCFPAI